MSTGANLLGAFIKERRIENGLTQAALGKLCGVSQTTIGIWESGTNKPSVENLKALSTVFSVEVSTLRKMLTQDTASAHVTETKNLLVPLAEMPNAYAALRDETAGAVAGTRQRVANEKLKADILATLRTNLPEAKFDTRTRSAFGAHWHIEIETAEIVVCIAASSNMVANPRNVMSLASLRAFNQDDRAYYLVLVQDESARDILQLTEPDAQETTRKQVDAEAALLGVVVERAFSVSKAVSIVLNANHWREVSRD